MPVLSNSLYGSTEMCIRDRATGATGPTGANGVTGPTGATGPAGDANSACCGCTEQIINILQQIITLYPNNNIFVTLKSGDAVVGLPGTLISVSYTHLTGAPRRPERTPGYTGPEGLCPVSYTHLDVYKRQTLRNGSIDASHRWGWFIYREYTTAIIVAWVSVIIFKIQCVPKIFS